MNNLTVVKNLLYTDSNDIPQIIFDILKDKIESKLN